MDDFVARSDSVRDTQCRRSTSQASKIIAIRLDFERADRQAKKVAEVQELLYISFKGNVRILVEQSHSPAEDQRNPEFSPTFLLTLLDMNSVNHPNYTSHRWKANLRPAVNRVQQSILHQKVEERTQHTENQELHDGRVQVI